ncbi:hypothetical protein ACAW74_04900 [Fibrella sp. WM1]|uniref:hypothetical protein n=1 Tax=Fibrella musci TaxID=3242485 RepID=UPI003522843E
MLRVYLDTQIIRYLSLNINNSNEYSDLLNLITKQKESFVLPYSIGHFSDLKRDLTDKKNVDLAFMSKIGMSKFFRFNFNINRLTVKEDDATKAYYSGKFNEYSNYSVRKSFTQRIGAYDQIKAFYESYIKVLEKAEKSKKTLSKEETNLYNSIRELVPFSRKDITMRKFERHLNKGLKNTLESSKDRQKKFVKSIYDDARSSYSLPKQQIDYKKPNLKVDLENSDLQNFIVDNIFLPIVSMFNKTDIESINNFHLFTRSYEMLELTGILIENLKATTVQSRVSDSLHAFTASYCDILITEDKKLTQKAKLLYGVLYINTLVFTAKEFLSFYNEYLSLIVIDPDQFLGFLEQDIRRHKIEQEKQGFKTNNQYFIESEWRYMGFFNSLQFIQIRGESIICLSRLTNNFDDTWSEDEIRLLVSTGLKTFGDDIGRRLMFDENVEINEIASGNWPGRAWFYAGYYIQIISDFNHINQILLTVSKPDR